MSSPLVSVIMPCFNGAPHLERSINSVRSQTFPSWELIVIDDGSTDQSASLIRDFCRMDSRISAVHQQNIGLSATRNRGLHAACSEFVAFLDVDDTWDARFLERMTHALLETPRAGIAYCGWQNVGLPGGRGERFVPPNYEGPDKTQILLSGCRWPVHAAVLRHRLVLAANGFDESLPSCEDYDLWLRVATVCELVRVPEVLAYYHHHEFGQMTKDIASIAINHWRVQRRFLRSHPGIRNRLGRRQVRALTHGQLLTRGNECYWNKDLDGARRIFRRVMKHGFGSYSDWLRMAPALIPLSLHKRIADLVHERGVGNMF